MTREWGTVPAERTVLVVSRTHTSLDRLLDVLPAIAGDTRIQVRFTVDKGSVFNDGVARRLRRLGTNVIAWHKAKKQRFDLILSASDHSDLHELDGKLVLLPHGAGYQKFSPHATPPQLSGLTDSALRYAGKPLVSTLVLSHPAQFEQVAATAPDLLERARVAGDPCLDRMRADRRRAEHRAALGLLPHHKLVTVTSTWGPESTMGRWPDLPTGLLAELPHDEFRVAAVLHPNVWVHHSPWQVRNWLERAEEAGLALIPPTGPWQLGLLAADCVLGDHGSLSAYTTGLAIPLLLAAFGDNEVAPGTPMETLGRKMGRFDPNRAAAEQIGKAIEDFRPEHHQELANQVFALPGASLRTLRDTCYELLELSQPPFPPRFSPFPTDPLDIAQPKSFDVTTGTGAGGALDLKRFPAVLSEFATDRTARHLASFVDETDPRLIESAAILLRWGTEDGWAARALAAYPGSRMAATLEPSGRVVLRTRDGSTAVADIDDATPGFPAELIASAAYHRLLSGRGPATCRLSAGAATAVLRLRT
ncbi:hypothetical protein [Amycolatopsis minnesotensis]|uniref:Uncharacterized protein n=1 Tax=Amycolatopsis minnesotensis TaxID=337894 RepID=A0ABN2RQT0_9PSEU